MQTPHNTWIGSLALIGLSLFSYPGQTGIASATAPDAEATISKARKTLQEIDDLVKAILDRQAARNRVGRSANVSVDITPDGWQSLFDGKSLAGWKQTDFAGGGEVYVEPGFRGGPAAIIVRFGDPLSGINWTKEVPRSNYEISLEAMRIDGGDFMCGLTFPVGESYASLILGGWGGAVVGISSIDNHDASENETTKYMGFPLDRWFLIRLRVTTAKLEAWIDNKQIVDQIITGRKISLRPGEIVRSIPLGISTYRTSSAFRAIRLRPVKTQ